MKLEKVGFPPSECGMVTQYFKSNNVRSISNFGHFHFVSDFNFLNEGLLLEIKSDLEWNLEPIVKS